MPLWINYTEHQYDNKTNRNNISLHANQTEQWKRNINRRKALNSDGKSFAIDLLPETLSYRCTQYFFLPSIFVCRFRRTLFHGIPKITAMCSCAFKVKAKQNKKSNDLRCLFIIYRIHLFSFIILLFRWAGG